MHVIQLNVKLQNEIKSKLEKAIREIGLYNEEEIKHHVQNGMDSKVHDLSDTIDITLYLEYIRLRNKIINKLIVDYGFLDDGASSIADDVIEIFHCETKNIN